LATRISISEAGTRTTDPESCLRPDSAARPVVSPAPADLGRMARAHPVSAIVIELARAEGTDHLDRMFA
jgi:hypothetical protein